MRFSSTGAQTVLFFLHYQIKCKGFHRSIRWLRLAGTSWDHFVQPAQSWVTYSGLPMTVSGWVLSVSKGGDTTSFLGNLVQCLTTLTVKTFSPCVQMEFSVFQFVHIAPCPVTGLGWEETVSIFCTPLIWCLYPWKRSPKPSVLQVEQSQLSQPLSYLFRLSDPFIIFVVPCWTHSNNSMSCLFVCLFAFNILGSP